MKKFFKSVLIFLLVFLSVVIIAIFITGGFYLYHWKFLGVLFSFLPWVVFVWYYLSYLK